MINTLAWSNHETASNNGRHRSTVATSFVPFATGHVRDSSIPAPGAVIAGAGPTSDTLTEGANTVSVPGPGRRKLSRPFESALIFGLNFKSVSSAVTSALITAASFTAASSLITATSSRTATRLRH